MDVMDFLKMFLAGIAAFGGVAALVGPLAAWLGKLWADRLMARSQANHNTALETLRAEYRGKIESIKAELLEGTENHRTRLKFASLLFERELDAACALADLVRGLVPYVPKPDMEQSDEYEAIAADLYRIERELVAFLRKHVIALDDEETELVEAASILAGQGKHEFDVRESDGNAIDAASRLVGQLKSAEQALTGRLRSKAAPLERLT